MLIITGLKKRVMEHSRQNKLRHFYSLFREGESVLDVGVSTEAKRGLPARNYFLKNYRYDPGTYTGLGIEDLAGMEDMFPGKRFVQYQGGKFPFSDKEFTWVFSNAVIEHVGDRKAQLLFINEMVRVAHNVFFTTPNKYFPVESHTNVLFLHWNDQLFFRWCTKNRPGITRDNLHLLSFSQLQRLLNDSDSTSASLFKNRLLGIPMTFTSICTKV